MSPTARPLRPYQAEAIDAVRKKVAGGKRRIVLQLPTGAGKTRIAAEIISSARAKGRTAIFVVPRLSLIDQSVAAFEREGIDSIGVLQGAHYRTDAGALIQVASAQTLIRRETPQSDIVLIDECHLQFEGINDWLTDPAWSQVPFIGLSATPWSKGMALRWNELVRPTSIAAMIADGFLCPFTIFAPVAPDLSEVRTLAGDFNEGDLSRACDRNEIVGNAIDTWLNRAEGRPTLVYGVDRKHAKHIEERFTEAGVSAAYIDCDTALFDREDIFERFRSGEVTVICNVATLDTGVDLPSVSCLVDARPTKSRIRYVQTIGRGLRIAAGKDRLIILDHAGNTERLGLVTDVNAHVDQLDDGEPRRNLDRGKRADDSNPQIRLCPEWNTVLPPRPVPSCPECGHKFLAVSLVRERDGELVEYGSGRAGKPAEPSQEVKDYWHSALIRIAFEKGYKPGWAANQFKAKFGNWPSRFPPPMREPTVEIRNWVKSRAIAYAKARAIA